MKNYICIDKWNGCKWLEERKVLCPTHFSLLVLDGVLCVLELPEGVRCVAEGVRCVAEGVRCVAEGVRCVAEGVRCVAEGVRCVAEGVRCVLEAVGNCALYAVSTVGMHCVPKVVGGCAEVGRGLWWTLC